MDKPQKITTSCYFKLYENEAAAACVVHGVYFEHTGTLLLDAVVYNGHWLDVRHMPPEQREVFQAALLQHVADDLFYV